MAVFGATAPRAFDVRPPSPLETFAAVIFGAEPFREIFEVFRTGDVQTSLSCRKHVALRLGGCSAYRFPEFRPELTEQAGRTTRLVVFAQKNSPI
jgi:hypothetical protein